MTPYELSPSLTPPQATPMTNIKLRPTVETSVFTFSQTLDPGFADAVDMVATIPVVKPTQGTRNKVAIMIILGPRESTRTPMGAYIYSVYDSKRDEAVQTILNNSEEGLLDMTKKLGMVITKKYQVPSYVCINGGVELTTFLEIIKTTLETIEEKYKDMEEQQQEQEILETK